MFVYRSLSQLEKPLFMAGDFPAITSPAGGGGPGSSGSVTATTTMADSDIKCSRAKLARGGRTDEDQRPWAMNIMWLW